jgi:hypothetical protein
MASVTGSPCHPELMAATGQSPEGDVDRVVWLFSLGETTLEHTPERWHVYNRDTLHLH